LVALVLNGEEENLVRVGPLPLKGRRFPHEGAPFPAWVERFLTEGASIPKQVGRFPARGGEFPTEGASTPKQVGRFPAWDGEFQDGIPALQSAERKSA